MGELQAMATRIGAAATQIVKFTQDVADIVVGEVNHTAAGSSNESDSQAPFADVIGQAELVCAQLRCEQRERLVSKLCALLQDTAPGRCPVQFPQSGEAVELKRVQCG